MVEIKEEFKIRFQKALDSRNMKPIDIAKKTGISESTISQYRSGYSKPKKERLVLIADALGVNPAWLMGLEAPMYRIDLSGHRTPLEKVVAAYLDMLNEAGKAEAVKRLAELTELEKYKE